MTRYRVAQWATGDVGMCSLRAIIEHPQFDLVGVRVYSDAKAGRDAGDLCGTAPTGVIATQDIEAILAARPDCVLYMPDRMELDVVCRLLAGGANVVTPLTNFNCRNTIEPEVRNFLENACQAGKSSLYCSGATPGWFTETLPFALSLLQRRIDCITLFDFADMSSRATPDMLFRVLPFGQDPATIPPVSAQRPLIAPGSLTMTAAALGLQVEEFVADTEFAVTRDRLELAAGTVEAGTIGGVRRTMSGLRDGKPVIRRVSTLYVTRNLDPAWELRETCQQMRVEGDVSLDATFTLLGSPEDHLKGSPGMTANPAVNAVPYVCDAPPGILQTDELPLMIGRFA